MARTKTRYRTFLDDWVDEEAAELADQKVEQILAQAKAEATAQGMAQGMAQGVAQGVAQAQGKEARLMTLRVLRKRFGRLPAPIVKRIGATDAATCEALVDRALEVDSLQELGVI